MNSVIRVLVVEDSKLMRNMISNILKRQSNIDVVATAENGLQAYKKILLHKPDIITLDINMPVMDGLELLRMLKRENIRVNVLVVSTLTQAGSRVAIEALELGAIDVVGKPGTGNLDKIENEIVSKVLAIFEERILKFNTPEPVSKTVKAKYYVNKLDAKNKVALNNKEYTNYLKDISPKDVNKHAIRDAMDIAKSLKLAKPKIIVIGISTGGPRALRIMLPLFSHDFPLPILISQHIPSDFTSSLVSSLSDSCSMKVIESVNGMQIEKGNIYISPGDKHQGVYKADKDNLHIKLAFDDGLHLYVPSVDYLFESIIQSVGNQAIAIIMTGMGSDGKVGLLGLKKINTLTIAQDESSCTVFGMPRAAIENSAVVLTLSLYDIVAFLNEYLAWKLAL